MYSFVIKVMTRIIVLFLITNLFVLAACKQPEKGIIQNDIADTSSVDISGTDTSATPITGRPVTTEREHPKYIPPEKNDIMAYHGIADDSIKRAFSFKPLATLCSLATVFIEKKHLLIQSDSASFILSQEASVHKLILEYKKLIESGQHRENYTPTLLQLTRSVEEEDSTSAILPSTGNSSFLSQGKFFFMGGAPFVSQVEVYNPQTYHTEVLRDEHGNPELRFQFLGTENIDFIFKSIYHFKKPDIRISFGPPVEAYDTYDGAPDEVKGIGSIIHSFKDRVPVFFITENGMLPAQIIHYQVAFTTQYRCRSDYPKLVMACAANIQPNDILGVFIPFDNVNAPTCTISRNGKWLWTADLDGDNIPEIACVKATMGSESLIEVLWLVNINGTWKIIDYGSEPECT
jgi:hypothetical protein